LCLGTDERVLPVPELISESQHETNEAPNHVGAGRATDETTTTPGSIFDDVESKLRVASPDEDTQTLWADIRTAFDEGGPTAVRSVIDDRIRQSRLAVEKDLKQTRSVTKSAAPKKKASPPKKAAASKRAAKK
jgi:hypothetical protein